MRMPATSSKRHHPALFREAINLTAARTGFAPRLIRKDYFCTILLEYLSTAAPSVVFKGGTCIAKVHADFYRLSAGKRRGRCFRNAGGRASGSGRGRIVARVMGGRLCRIRH
jgi:hypothetical protein